MDICQDRQEQAALLDIITGKINPSGKLNETLPVKYEDVPSYNYFPSKERTSEYREGIFVGYRYYDTAKVPVKYPFGYGLSYTTFEYSDINVARGQGYIYNHKYRKNGWRRNCPDVCKL